MDAVTSVPAPVNEPVHTYAPGSAERESLQRRVAELEAEKHELPQTIGGRRRLAGGEAFDVVQPHDHAHVLGVSANATREDVTDAELAKFRARARGGLVRSLGSNQGLANALAHYQTLYGDWRELFRELAAI